MTLWSVSTWPRYIFRIDTFGSRIQHLRDVLARIVALLLLLSLCPHFHAQDDSSDDSDNYLTPDTWKQLVVPDDIITSVTSVITPETRVLISAPYAISSRSLNVFTTGIPIQPVYIQAPSGLVVWLTIQCHGGAARVTVPNFVANFTLVQTDPTGEWILPSLPLNNSWPVTGLGIKFYQNVSIANNALDTLRYGKGADNDIVGKATMTITLNWNVTSVKDNRVIVFNEFKTISIWAPTALTSLSTFQATVAGVCVVGILGLCCIGCLNSFGITYLRRYNVLMARETRDQLECEQNRVFNPMWMPCAPSEPGYYNIESTPNSMLLVTRRMEIKTLILRTPTTFSLMDRLIKAKSLKSSDYRWSGFQLPWAAAPPRRLLDLSSDDEFPLGIPIAARRGSQLQVSQFREAAMMKQQLGARTSVQLPQNYSLQRATNYNWQQAQAHAQAQAQAQAAKYNTQKQMYPGASYYPQQIAQVPAMYPGNQHGNRYPAAQGNQMKFENITVGFALVHHRFTQDVPTDERPLSKEIYVPGHHSLCEALGGHSALPGEKVQDSKGEELMNLESFVKQFTPECQDSKSYRVPPGNLLDPVSKLGCHHCESVEEVVAGAFETGSVKFEGGVSELQDDIFPREEVGDERGSEDSDMASESFGSPLSDLYEDVLESCSPTNSILKRLGATCRAESP